MATKKITIKNGTVTLKGEMEIEYEDEFFPQPQPPIPTPTPTPHPQPPVPPVGNTELTLIGFGGKTTTGGKGGRIIKVTTNDGGTGPGTFRRAVEIEKGPRIVVFDGVNDIKLGNKVGIRDGNLTIDGRTAGGVQLRGDVSIRSDNIIITGIAFRDGTDPLQILDASNIVIDHCSMMWGKDENASICAYGKNVKNITISHCILAQGINTDNHAMGLLVNAEGGYVVNNITIYGNLFAYNLRRNPWVKFGKPVEVINNMIFGAGTPEEALHLGDNRGHAPGEIHGHIIGNYMQLGPESPKVDESHILIRDPEGRYYIHDNLDVDAQDRILNLPIDGRTNRIEKAPVFWGSGLPMLSAQQTKDYVLKNAGMFPEDRDETDQWIINLVRSKSGGLVTKPNLKSMGIPKSFINRYYN